MMDEVIVKTPVGLKSLEIGFTLNSILKMMDWLETDCVGGRGVEWWLDERR